MYREKQHGLANFYMGITWLVKLIIVTVIACSRLPDCVVMRLAFSETASMMPLHHVKIW